MSGTGGVRPAQKAILVAFGQESLGNSPVAKGLLISLFSRRKPQFPQDVHVDGRHHCWCCTLVQPEAPAAWLTRTCEFLRNGTKFDLIGDANLECDVDNNESWMQECLTVGPYSSVGKSGLVYRYMSR